MKSLRLAMVSICFAIIVCVAYGQVDMTIVESPDAPGKLPVTTLQHCMLQLAREWNLPLKNLPRILVLHVSQKYAKPFVESELVIRRNSGPQMGEYYEVWIVGRPGRNYVLGLENVLEHHFRMKPSEGERAKVIARIFVQDDSTVSVSDLQGK